jgi:hypothetical protein
MKQQRLRFVEKNMKKKYYERGKGRGRKQADRVKKVVKAKRKSRKEEVQLAMLHVQNKIGLNN